ncbi:hypothetical protein [Streptomyces sp. NPDC006446]|uniref:hypothetical protein n=1 Tax=Streptomyces sp. NPDC006446 TaxID=3154301 RepID=UPI0033AF56D4
MAALRTYEETGVAHARSNGTLHTADATITKLTSRTTSGRDGGGQDGGSGDWFVTTKYTVELRVGDETKAVDGVPNDFANDLQEGHRVEAGLWHGRVVEIDGRDVWPGWHPGGRDITLVLLYPFIMGYLIALAMTAAACLAGLGGRYGWSGITGWGPGGSGSSSGWRRSSFSSGARLSGTGSCTGRSFPWAPEPPPRWWG